jgi:hypothetical protein
MGVHYHKRPIVKDSGLLIDADNKVSYPNSGSTIRDLVARNDGTFQNGITVVDGGMELDGVDQWVDFADEDFAKFDRTDSFSIEFWIDKDTGSVFDWLCGRQGTDNSYRGWGVLYRNSPDLGKLAFILYNTASTDGINVITPTAYNDGLHHHVITYDGSSLASGVNIYTDGVGETLTVNQDDLTSTAIAIGTSARFVIGRRFNESANYTQGGLKKLVIYPKELTQAEALYNYETQKSRYAQ